jgi:NAD(P)H dehydrogenase (quinone)
MVQGARVAILYYSMYGHVRQMAVSAKKGIESAGGHADLYQIPETLSQDVLKMMQAPPKSDDPLATMDTLTQYDAFLFGIPTRYGTMPAQFRAFWDQTGFLWRQGSLIGKYFGIFVSTGSIGGGQETTILTSLPNFAHHGMIFVPFGLSAPAIQSNLEEVHGGSLWGAGTFAGTGARQPTELELELASTQGKRFQELVSRVTF